MKKSGFTDEKIIGILRENRVGASTTDISRKHGISDTKLYNRRKASATYRCPRRQSTSSRQRQRCFGA